MIDLETFSLPGGTIAFKAISGPGRRMPNSFKLSIEKVIDLKIFGPPSGPKASSSFLSSETMENIRFLMVLLHFVKESLYFLRFFDTCA